VNPFSPPLPEHRTICLLRAGSLQGPNHTKVCAMNILSVKRPIRRTEALCSHPPRTTEVFRGFSRAEKNYFPDRFRPASHNNSHITHTIIFDQKSTQPIPNQRETAKARSSNRPQKNPNSHINPNLGSTDVPPLPAAASPAELRDSRPTPARDPLGNWHLVSGISLGRPS
jgi:hypothetical protein